MSQQEHTDQPQLPLQDAEPDVAHLETELEQTEATYSSR